MYSNIFEGLTFHMPDEKIKSDCYHRYTYGHYDVAGERPKKYMNSLSHADNLHSFLKNAPQEDRDLWFDNFPVCEEDVVLELGAYLGFGTMWLAQRAKFVYAVEMMLRNYIYLERNIEHNQLDNVKTIHAAVSNKDDAQRHLYSRGGQRNSLSSKLRLKKTPFSFFTTTIDKLIDTGQIVRPVSWITLEVNGEELNALKGMQKLLAQKRCRVMAAGWYPKNNPVAPKIKNYLEGYGFFVGIGPYGKVYAMKGMA